GRCRYMERPYRLSEHDGLQPHQPGARNREGCDGSGAWKSKTKTLDSHTWRGGAAYRYHQRDDRYTRGLRRPGNERGPRSGCGRKTRRTSKRSRCIRYMEESYRKREPACAEPNHTGACDLRCGIRGNEG